MVSLVTLGRQPALGLAELESLFGSSAVRPVGHQAAIVEVEPDIFTFDRLGGSVKFCKVLTTLDTTNWKEIEKFLLKVSPGHTESMPEGKMTLGLSIVGLDINQRQLEATGLSLKKAIRKTGRSVRLVPNKAPELNTAQVIHNKLTSPNGWELIFVRDKNQTIIAQTVQVQDIEAYTRRDRERPKRDTKVGMLPPKLAQIIINLAVDTMPADKLESISKIPSGQEIPLQILDKTILDPFCGTGVVLQEAALMGYSAYGTDLEPRMIDYTNINLDWLVAGDGSKLTHIDYTTKVGDATSHAWDQSFDHVACETYLGRPLTSLPDHETLVKIMSDCDTIHRKFLRNLARQTKSGMRMCIAVPAWKTRNGFKHLKTLDSLEELGYNRIRFEHSSEAELIYHRPDQVVARELVVLERK